MTTALNVVILNVVNMPAGFRCWCGAEETDSSVLKHREEMMIGGVFFFVFNLKGEHFFGG